MARTTVAVLVVGMLLSACATPAPAPTPTPTPVEVAVEPTATAPPTNTPEPSPTPTITPTNEGCVRATTEIPESENPSRFVTSGPATGCYDSVGAFLDDIGLTLGEFAPGTVITFWTQWPVNPDGSVVYPTPTPTPIPPTASPTPDPWQTYLLDYHFSGAPMERVTAVLLPIPREWDGVGMRNVRILEIYPQPTNLIQDQHANQIAYWAVTDPNITDYGVAFKADLATARYSVDPNKVEPYDTGSDLYTRYTRPSSRIQSTHPDIVAQARRIVGQETNPYRQALMVHAWVTQNISSDGGTVDAIAALYERRANCSVNHLYIALLRSLGIPARLVSCLHPLPTAAHWSAGVFNFGQGTLGAHIYAEFYLPGYGWIQSDATSRSKPAGTPYVRIILAKGEDIDLGHNWGDPTLGWIHLPHAWGINAEPFAYLDVTPVAK